MSQVAAPPRRWLDRMFQMRLSVFALTVAGCALICWAILYYRANMNPARAMTNQQIVDLSSGSPTARRNAARALDGILPSLLGDGVPALVKALRNDPDPQVRAASAASLATSLAFYFACTNGEIPPQRDAASLALVAALGDESAVVRAAAARGLNILSQKTTVVRGKGVSLGVDPKVVTPPLLRLLDDPDPVASLSAFRALRNMKVDPATILPSLRRLARESTPIGRAEVVASLAQALRSRMGSPEEIVAYLDDPDVRVRIAAALALFEDPNKQLKPWGDSDAVARALSKRLEESAPSERSTLVEALASFRSLPDEVVPALIKVMDADNDDVQDQNQRQLIVDYTPLAITSASPKAAKAALPALVRAAAKQTSGSTTASFAVGTLAPDSDEARSLIPLLMNLLRTSQMISPRIAAADILGMMGPQSSEAAPALLEAVLDRDGLLSLRACNALERMGPKAKFAVPKLAEIANLHLKSGPCPNEIIHAILTLDPLSPEAADLLLVLTLDPFARPGLYYAAVSSYLETPAARVLADNPTLRAALKSDDPERRTRARAIMDRLQPE